MNLFLRLFNHRSPKAHCLPLYPLVGSLDNCNFADSPWRAASVFVADYPRH